MKTIVSIMASASALLMLAGCVAKSNDGEKARADYAASLSDSIAAVQSEIDSCDSRISVLRDDVADRMADFTTVSNPREAGSYTILTSYKDKYPLRSTGLVARINDNGQFELIAALAGQPFDCIEVQAPEVTVSSATVPNDQALNYRTAALTTVLFTGPEADSIGEMISENELNPLTVVYMQGRPVKSVKLSDGEAKMISYTYMLYKRRQDLAHLERKVPMLHEKINLLRLHRDKDNMQNDSAGIAAGE